MSAPNLTVALPHPRDIKQTVDGMLGRDVQISPGEAWVPTDTAPAVVAEYVTDQLVLGAVAVTDLSLSVLAGAAMGLLPRGGAEDMITAVDPSLPVLENLYELLNVLANTMNRPDGPHVRLTRLHGLGEPLPRDVAALVGSLGNRLDLVLELPGYGRGKLAVLA